MLGNLGLLTLAVRPRDAPGSRGRVTLRQTISIRELRERTSDLSTLGQLWGRDVVVTGSVAFRPSGSILRIEAERIERADTRDLSLWSADPKKIWVYDLRTNKHFTLKTKRMTRADLDEFVACYTPGERQKRKPTWPEKSPEGRWRAFSHDEIVAIED